jgi:hypothetical protein
MKLNLENQQNKIKSVRKKRSYYMLSLLLLLFFLISGMPSNAQGTWTKFNNLAPQPSGGLTVLLSDGSLLARAAAGTGSGNAWMRLTPDTHGSYVNGTWTTAASAINDRLYFSTQVLRDGRVYVAGGEDGAGGSSAEIYDPVANTWTALPDPGHRISDANSEILPDGRVLQSLIENAQTSTLIYDPVANAFTNGPSTSGSFNESAWVKLADNSILFVDKGTSNAERYIPSLNQWVADAQVPVSLYDVTGDETGPGLLLPDGRAFFVGSTGYTAYYTPSGSSNPGTWTTGPMIPNGLGAPDAAGAALVNGKALYSFSPVPTASNEFSSPTYFYEFNYLTNSFTLIGAPDGGSSENYASFVTTFLALPDGNVLYSVQGNSQFYIYTPGGTPLAAGKPSITQVNTNNCQGTAYTITGTKFNGISEGAAYGDDWQMASNYPLVRLTNGSNVYYARTYNWNSTGVQTGSLVTTAQFDLPAGLPNATYSLVVVANGISSDPVSFTPTVGTNCLTASITSPANNATFTAPASITINASAAEPGASISKVEFYNGTTLLGTSTTSPYSFSWTNVAAGTYNLTVKAYDNKSTPLTVTSSIVAVTVTGGTNSCSGVPTYQPYPAIYNLGDYVQYNGIKYQSQANGLYNVTPGTAEWYWKTIGACGTTVVPTVSITAPTDGSTTYYLASSNPQITATVNVNSNQTTIDSVNYILVETVCNGAGCTSVRRFKVTTAPYSISYAPKLIGNGWSQLNAIAFSGGVASTQSTVTYYAVALPELSIVSPAVSSFVPRNTSTIPVTVSVNTSNINIDSVVYNIQDVITTGMSGQFTYRKFVVTTAPYNLNLPVLAGQTLTRITATAYGDAGKASAAQLITVTYDDLPVVTITAPLPKYTNNTIVYLVGGSLTVAANVSDDDGTITRVVFSVDGGNAVTVTSAPYAVTFNNLPAPLPDGSIYFNVVAYDNSGASTSALVVGYVDRAPNIALTFTTTTFNAGANIVIPVFASDADGIVAKVDFYNGTTLLGTSTTAPFTFTWNNVAAGTYAITAKATDDLGVSTTSNAVTVTVNGNTGGCTNIPVYSASNPNYVAGSVVQNVGHSYQCKPYPYSGWCNGAAWAYAPGTGTYWTDAWIDNGACPSGTGRMSDDHSLVGVAPNPTHGTFALGFDGLGFTTADVTLFDSYGVAVLTVKEYSASTSLDISVLPSGIYLIKVNSGAQTFTKRLIKN